jgi:hypothetical protein
MLAEAEAVRILGPAAGLEVLEAGVLAVEALLANPMLELLEQLILAAVEVVRDTVGALEVMGVLVLLLFLSHQQNLI